MNPRVGVVTIQRLFLLVLLLGALPVLTQCTRFTEREPQPPSAATQERLLAQFLDWPRLQRDYGPLDPEPEGYGFGEFVAVYQERDGYRGEGDPLELAEPNSGEWLAPVLCDGQPVAAVWILAGNPPYITSVFDRDFARRLMALEPDDRPFRESSSFAWFVLRNDGTVRPFDDRGAMLWAWEGARFAESEGRWEGGTWSEYEKERDEYYRIHRLGPLEALPFVMLYGLTSTTCLSVGALVLVAAGMVVYWRRRTRARERT